MDLLDPVISVTGRPTIPVTGRYGNGPKVTDIIGSNRSIG